jgi:hypothetical protein
MHRHSHGTSGRASYGSPETLSSRELPADPCRHLVCQALQHRCVDAVVDGDHVIVFCERGRTRQRRSATAAGSRSSECARRLACWAGCASDEHTSEVAQQLGAIEKCLASTVINKSKAGSDSNLCTVASRHISAHGRPERCSSRIWQVWWSMHKCRSDAAAAMCTRCWRKVES